MKWKPFVSGAPYTCQECPSYLELKAEVERLRSAIRHLYFNEGVCYGEGCDDCETVFWLVGKEAMDND